jgi:CDP-diglyceride synthetase
MDIKKGFFAVLLSAFLLTVALLAVLVVWEAIDFESARDTLVKITLTFAILAAMSLLVMFITKSRMQTNK